VLVLNTTQRYAVTVRKAIKSNDASGCANGSFAACFCAVAMRFCVAELLRSVCVNFAKSPYSPDKK
jgi:hypothetical protein